ncbi:hypothetical protein [Aurantimonas sp. VKM B-3413]|nr:hypothetical protein [Aurantimonas sp. VKM B-3413]
MMIVAYALAVLLIPASAYAISLWVERENRKIDDRARARVRVQHR